MDFNDIAAVNDRDLAHIKTNSRKRKWREIEVIKEQRRLERELLEIDPILSLVDTPLKTRDQNGTR